MLEHIFLDIDGVVADFNLASSKLVGVTLPTCSEVSFAWVWEQVRNEMTEFEYLQRLADEPNFWASLPLYPWARALTEMLDACGVPWSFLSSTTYSEKSFSGKVLWLQENFSLSYMSKLILVNGGKDRLARPSYLLVDDKLSNVEKWRKKGGSGFDWRVYTADNPLGFKQVNQLKTIIENMILDKQTILA